MSNLRPGAMPPRPGTADAKIIFLAGAVAHWWDDNWDTPQHYEYMKWREDVRTALIAGGYLTYAHYEAFKGTWNPRAQAVNSAALGQADLMLILTGEDIPSPGTDEEVKVAEHYGVPILRVPSSVGLARLLPMVEGALTYGDSAVSVDSKGQRGVDPDTDGMVCT